MRWLRSHDTPTYLTHVSVMFTPPVLVYYETGRYVQQHCQHQHVCTKYCSWFWNKIALCGNNVSICMRVPHVVVYCEPGWCVAIVSVSVYVCHLQLFTVKLDSNVWQQSVYVCAHHMPWYTQHGIHSVCTDSHVSK